MKKYKWFTLVELMIVIAIIWILSAILYPSLTWYFERARDTKKKAEINQINLAIINYNIDNLTYKVWNSWQYNNWNWYMNIVSQSYKKSIIDALVEYWYLKKWSIRIFESWKFDKTLKNNFWCEKRWLDFDLFLYYFDDSTWRYSISATMENPKQEDVDNLLKLYYSNTILNWRAEWTCNRYWHNYWVGN